MCRKADVAREDPHFAALLALILARFRDAESLLEPRGSLVVRRLCALLGAERVFLELAALLAAPAPDGPAFPRLMVQASLSHADPTQLSRLYNERPSSLESL